MTEFVVTVARTGGFAGIRREWRAQAGDDWMPVIENCPWDSVKRPAPHPDGFVWRIEVHLHATETTGATDSSRLATLQDAQVTGPWRELVDRVQERSST